MTYTCDDCGHTIDRDEDDFAVKVVDHKISHRPPLGTVTHCARCGSDQIGWDPADGYTCNGCGGADSDE